MKYNFDFEFRTEDGSGVTLSSQGEKKPLKMKEAAVKALLYPPKDLDVPGPEKIQRYDLAVKISNFGSEAELTAEEAELTKKAMAMIYIPVVVGQASAILEGKEPQIIKM